MKWMDFDLRVSEGLVTMLTTRTQNPLMLCGLSHAMSIDTIRPNRVSRHRCFAVNVFSRLSLIGRSTQN